MDDDYSDDDSSESQTRQKRKAEDDTQYDAHLIKATAELNHVELNKRIEAGECFEREEIRQLLSDSTDSAVRVVAKPTQVRQFGETFSSLSGALVASKMTPMTVDTCSGERRRGVLHAVRRDLSLDIETTVPAVAQGSSGPSLPQQQTLGMLPPLPMAPRLHINGSDIVCIHIPQNVLLATNLIRYIKDNGSTVSTKKRRRGGKSMAAEHAPVGLQGR